MFKKGVFYAHQISADNHIGGKVTILLMNNLTCSENRVTQLKVNSAFTKGVPTSNFFCFGDSLFYLPVSKRKENFNVNSKKNCG